MSRSSFSIGAYDIAPGTRKDIELPLARLVTGTPVSLPVLVFHGANDGPTIWVNAALHGDEVSGIEIIRRVTELLNPETLRGTLLAVPIVNVHGFLTGDRYLPDRRDLNRSFPGRAKGSLASRIAHIFMTEVASRCSVGIDLHSGSDHRSNLAQIRANLDDAKTNRLATVFAAPMMIHSKNRQGSLRKAATDLGASVLVFEGGEAWRLDQPSIRYGVDGVLRILAHEDMIDLPAEDQEPPVPQISRKTRWMRAPQSGIGRLRVELGEIVAKGQLLGEIYDAFGTRLGRVTSRADGMIVGLALDAIVNRGDAIANVAELTTTDQPDSESIEEPPGNAEMDHPDEFETMPADTIEAKEE